VPSRVEISVRERVQLYERGFRRKPDRRVVVDEVDAGATPGHRRRTPQCHRQSAFLPDDSDMHLGRERPPENPSRDRDRGVAEGVAHAPDASVTTADSRADFDTDGEERRPFNASEGADYQEHRGSSAGQVGRPARELSRRTARGTQGTTAPASVVPPPFLRLCCSEHPGEKEHAPVRSMSECSLRAISRSPRRRRFSDGPGVPPGRCEVGGEDDVTRDELHMRDEMRRPVDRCFDDVLARRASAVSLPWQTVSTATRHEAAANSYERVLPSDQDNPHGQLQRARRLLEVPGRRIEGSATEGERCSRICVPPPYLCFARSEATQGEKM
jgi:hypothetical protein